MDSTLYLLLRLTILLFVPLALLQGADAFPLQNLRNPFGRREITLVSPPPFNSWTVQSNAVAMNLSKIVSCDPDSMTGLNGRMPRVPNNDPIKLAGIVHGKSCHVFTGFTSFGHVQYNSESSVFNSYHPLDQSLAIGTTLYWDRVRKGANDAANLTGVEIDWYMPQNNIFDPAYMAEQIHLTANSRRYDGLFLTIPNSDVASSVMRVAREQVGMPVVVVNVGQQTASQMGYLAVLQNDTDAGEKLGYALYDRGIYYTLENVILKQFRKIRKIRN